jgi:HPr kinase/phosphorylase
VGRTQIHGSLIEVCDLGVLILGPSGVGKSECVIELVRRGQRMVADDVVRLWTSEDGKRLFGRSPESIRHHIEVRGLGLLCVADLYGREAVLDESEIHLLCRLEGWREGRHYERIGLDRPVEAHLGVSLPAVTLPVHAASNLATLVELAARDWKLRKAGVNAARRLDERLRNQGSLGVGAGSEGGGS